MRTPAQMVVLADYRAARASLRPVLAAHLIREAYAVNIARTLADGHTPTRPQLDRFRVADQWVTTVVQRDIVRLGRAS